MDALLATRIEALGLVPYAQAVARMRELDPGRELFREIALERGDVRIDLRGGLAGLRDDDAFGLEFEVESYLEGHARRFVRRFDPNCYLYLSRSMDWFDLGEGCGGDVMRGLAGIRIDKALAIGVHTDILFPLQQQEQIAEGLRAGGCDAAFLPLESPQGHDAFLVDFDRFGPAVRAFLGSVPLDGV